MRITRTSGRQSELSGHSARHRRRGRTPAKARRWGTLTFCVAVAALTTLVTVTAAAETPVGESYAPHTIHSTESQEGARWAERTRVAGNLNSDGIADLFVAEPQYKRNGVPYGRVFAVDGASLADPNGQKGYAQPIFKIHPPEPQAGKQFGFTIENLGDLNGDGKPEIVAGTDAQDVPIDPTNTNSQDCEPHPERCRQSLGKAWVFDGHNNNVLYELESPERTEGTPSNSVRFGSRLGRAGDVTGDGVSEVIVGASNLDDPAGCSNSGVATGTCRRNEGAAYIFNGTNGALVRELRMPEEDDPTRPCQNGCGSFGLSVQGPGDVDGDGVPDQSVGAPSLRVGANDQQGRMYVFSGATGDVIRRIDNPEPQAAALFGFQDVTPLDPGDVNGDGKADIYVMGFQQVGEGGPDQGKAWVFDGGAGTPVATPLLYEVQNQNRQRGNQFGWSMTRDRNRNTQTPGPLDPVTNPLYVGNAPHHFQPNPNQQGETNTFNASTGAHQRTFPLPAPWNAEGGAPGNLGPNLGWTVSSPGDLDGDGFRDFLAGAPFTDVCNVRLGWFNKYLNENEGVMIVFESLPAGEPEPPPADQNPADNACSEKGEEEPPEG